MPTRARLPRASRCRIRDGWSSAGGTRYGFEAAEAWCRFNNAPAPLTLRANRLRIDARRARRALGAGVDTEPAPLRPRRPDRRRGNPLLSRSRTRACSSSRTRPRSSSASWPARARRAGARCLRVARGQDDGDGGDGPRHARRRRRPRRRVGCWRDVGAGAARSRVVQADAAQPLPFAAVFDCVLLDAPCFGLGTLRRDPDIKWRRSRRSSTRSPLQLAMLTRSGRGRPAGRPARLRDLLERAGGERGGRRALPRRAARFRPAPLRVRRRRTSSMDAAAPADAAVSRRPRGVLRRRVGESRGLR